MGEEIRDFGQNIYLQLVNRVLAKNNLIKFSVSDHRPQSPGSRNRSRAVQRLSRSDQVEQRQQTPLQ